jgi:signal transduction histidine kinase
MVIIIMKSINRSIRGLDEATSRVAEGDLNFELKPQGNDEFTSLTKSFELMRKELKDNQEQRSRFLMGVSHDLKTPLTSIEGYLEAIDDGIADNPDKLQKYISIIKNKSKVLEERIVQLIDFVKMERGEWELQKNEINLGEYLKNLAINYTEDIPVFKRMFHFKIDLPNEYKVYADVPLLTRAFENLIANAIQYTREEDTIILEARKSEAGVVIILKDSGPGIPEQEKEKIFEPFYRGTSSRREQGTGLGLSVVKSIFNSHGWRIEVKSTLNQGTEFVISIREKDV